MALCRLSLRSHSYAHTLLSSIHMGVSTLLNAHETQPTNHPCRTLDQLPMDTIMFSRTRAQSTLHVSSIMTKTVVNS